jgi:glycosyltransferase involved in cell wall biosynthesis
MKVLHIINNLEGGGAEKLLADLMPLFKKKGVEVTLLTITKSNTNTPYEEQLLKESIPLYKLNVSRNNYFSMLLKTFTFLNKNRFDIVHAHLFPVIYIAAICKLFLKFKLVMTEHGVFNKRRNFYLLRMTDRWVYSKMDKIIAISDEVTDSLTKQHCESHRLQKIPNGISLNKYKPVNKVNFDYKIGMAGRFESPKDQSTIIRALTYLPKNIHLYLAGAGSLQEKLYQTAIDNKVTDRVHFLGFVNDMPDFFASIDFHVFSSKNEGFGLAVAESMAMGVPTIVSDIAALKEVVGNSGFIFETGNEHHLAKVINELYLDASKYKEISNKSITHAQQFDILKTADAYIQLYQSLT